MTREVVTNWTILKGGRKWLGKQDSEWMEDRNRDAGSHRKRERRGVDQKKQDCRNPERICQLSLGLILMEASAPLPLTHVALIPVLLS